jgi:EmrB/QacA subfamily drug resistance transporter
MSMRPYLIFFSIGLSLLMYAIDVTAVAVAFPSIITGLGTNVLWAAWTISIYLVAVTSAMPLMGNLSDSLGRKKICLISLIVFTSSSVACGLSPNIYSLIAFRFLQGIGGASFLPTAAGIVTDQFPEHRERAIGLFSSIFPIGGMVGPNLGGWIVSRYSWRYIFYINLPIGILLIVLISILLKESKGRSRPRIDFRGASFLFSGILFFMLALNLIAENLSISTLFLAGIFSIVSFFSLSLFIRQEKNVSNPILDMTLLRSKPFLAANIYNMIGGAGVFGIFSLIPFYATSVHQLSTLASGMILTPRSIGMISTSTLTSFLLIRWGYRWPMVLGTSIVALTTLLLAGPGFQLFSMAGIHWGVAGILAFLIMVVGIGQGIALPASNNACIELMPEKVATITGLRGMFRSVGGAVGISLITIILHLSPTPAAGFRTTFILFGLGLIISIPLVFLMPTGKKEWSQA